MNKRLNSVLFILAATVLNIVLMFVLFLATFILFARFLAPVLPPGINRILPPVLLVGSVIGTYVIYHRIMKWATHKYNLEQYFAPLFGRRDGPRRGD